MLHFFLERIANSAGAFSVGLIIMKRFILAIDIMKKHKNALKLKGGVRQLEYIMVSDPGVLAADLVPEVV